jgi:hypothetical protein
MSDSESEDEPPPLLHSGHWQANSSSDEDADNESMTAISRPCGRPPNMREGNLEKCSKVASNSASQSCGLGSGHAVCGQRHIMAENSSKLRSSMPRSMTPPMTPGEIRTLCESKVAAESTNATRMDVIVPSDTTVAAEKVDSEPSDSSEDHSLVSTSTGIASTIACLGTLTGRRLPRASVAINEVTLRVDGCEEGLEGAMLEVWTDADFDFDTEVNMPYDQLIRKYGITTVNLDSTAQEIEQENKDAGEHAGNVQHEHKQYVSETQFQSVGWEWIFVMYPGTTPPRLGMPALDLECQRITQ